MIPILGKVNSITFYYCSSSFLFPLGVCGDVIESKVETEGFISSFQPTIGDDGESPEAVITIDFVGKGENK